MQLSDFIRETLISIDTGLREANDTIESKRKPHRNDTTVDDRYITYFVESRLDGGKAHIDFDVAVVAGDTSATGGKSGIQVYGIGLGGSKESSKSVEITSRVKFTVTIHRTIS